VSHPRPGPGPRLGVRRGPHPHAPLLQAGSPPPWPTEVLRPPRPPVSLALRAWARARPGRAASCCCPRAPRVFPSGDRRPSRRCRAAAPCARAAPRGSGGPRRARAGSGPGLRRRGTLPPAAGGSTYPAGRSCRPAPSPTRLRAPATDSDSVSGATRTGPARPGPARPGSVSADSGDSETSSADSAGGGGSWAAEPVWMRACVCVRVRACA
jgi:hypothetical protein